jgi:hypothetical protein
VEITPSTFCKKYSVPQKHPEAKMARSVFVAVSFICSFLENPKVLSAMARVNNPIFFIFGEFIVLPNRCKSSFSPYGLTLTFAKC